MALSYCVLPARGVLKISGEDRVTFLQGLVSNDVTKASDTSGVYSAFLTPQGKFICDFFLLASDDSLLIDIAADALPAFKKKLTMFKLRADVKIDDVSEDYDILAVFGDTCAPKADCYADPRHSDLGCRAFVSKGTGYSDGEEVDFAVYDLKRIQLGIPDGARDMTPEKSILLENGFDELNGVDWKKGCYMGQELTARTKYRALIKKRLFPVTLESDAPESGTEIMAGDKSVGEIHSSVGTFALATVKLDAVDEDLTAAGIALSVTKPDWMVIPEPK